MGVEKKSSDEKKLVETLFEGGLYEELIWIWDERYIIVLMLQWKVSCINYKDYDLTTSGFFKFKACHLRKSAI